MNGIKMKDCIFYVDKEKRTVVCKIPNTEDMFGNFLVDNFKFDQYIYMWGEDSIFKLIQMPKSFIGKAVCAKDDEWDEDFGKLIAFSRAKAKCYKSFFKRANRLVQAIDMKLGDMIDTFNVFGSKLEERQNRIHNKIAYRLGDTKKEGDA